MRLTGAITEYNSVSNSIVFLCEGYILISSCFPQRVFVRVKVYYFPHLNGTIIDEEDLIGDTKEDRAKSSGLTLHKYYRTDDIDTWEIQV